MRRPGVRIATGLAVIALLAIDFGWMRRIVTGQGSLFGLCPDGEGEAGIFDLGILAMSNLLGFGFLEVVSKP